MFQFEYSHHPKYNFFQNPYFVSKFNVETFDILYKKVGNASNLSVVERDELRIKLINLAKEVFNELCQQAEDIYERVFINELKEAVVVLIEEELKFFYRKKKHINPKKTCEILIDLRERRCHIGKISQQSIDKIHSISKNQVELFRTNASFGRLTREDLSINTGPLVSKITKILNNEFKKQGALDNLGQYMGTDYILGGCALELSVPMSTWWRNKFKGIKAPETMYAHIDESIGNPKAIIYLSNVGENNGPTEYYLGAYEALKLNSLQELVGRVINVPGNDTKSTLHQYYKREYHQVMSSENMRKHFMRIPEIIRFNSHFGWDVVSGSAMENSLLKRKREVLGPQGTYILFDGSRLLHRGGLIEFGERLALQAVFIPKPSLSYKLKSYPKRALLKMQNLLKRSI